MKSFFYRISTVSKILETRSVILFGPRQTGKTSYVKNQLKDQVSYTFNLLDTALQRRLLQNPSAMKEEIYAENLHDCVVFIDEIQKVPQLLDDVHLLIEERNIRFLLTGSSPRKIKHAGYNLLGGRASNRSFNPFSYMEIPADIRENLSLEKIFHHGMLPSVFGSEEADDLLYSYTETYLQDEIAAEGAVRNLPGFTSFLSFAAKTNTEIINFSNLANDSGIKRQVITNWYEILEDTLIGYRVESWKNGSKRKITETAKFYFFDPGVARILTGIPVPNESQTEYGVLFENFIFCELKAYLDYRAKREKINYWRTQNGTLEVDFVINDTAIETKTTRTVQKKDLKGLAAIAEEASFSKRIVVCREPGSRLTDDGILILNWRRFLEKLWAGEILG